MVLVKPLQHANVRQAERTAPLEHQADFLSRLCVKKSGHKEQENRCRRRPAF